MKIRTKELIFRLTASAISFALSGAVFGVAVTHSKEVPINAQAAANSRYETCTKEIPLDPRPRADLHLFGSFEDQL